MKSVVEGVAPLRGIKWYRSLSDILGLLPPGRGGAGVPPSTVKRWIRAGVTPVCGRHPVRRPALRLGGRWYDDPAEFEQFLLALSVVK